VVAEAGFGRTLCAMWGEVCGEVGFKTQDCKKKLGKYSIHNIKYIKESIKIK
jgi:hypothetical protein